jgi:hypothetical protein
VRWTFLALLDVISPISLDSSKDFLICIPQPGISLSPLAYTATQVTGSEMPVRIFPLGKAGEGQFTGKKVLSFTLASTKVTILTNNSAQQYPI